MYFSLLRKFTYFFIALSKMNMSDSEDNKICIIVKVIHLSNMVCLTTG